MKKLLLLPLLALITISTLAQKQNKIGIEVTAERTGGEFTTGLGVTFDHQVSQHNGLESGIFYRTNKSEYLFNLQNQLSTYTIIEKFISVPILYKYFSPILNLSAGPTLDFYLGWKQKHIENNVLINSYSLSKNVFVGFMIKAGKPINLSDKMILEPEARLNPIIGSNTVYGFGLALKYKLGKISNP